MKDPVIFLGSFQSSCSCQTRENPPGWTPIASGRPRTAQMESVLHRVHLKIRTLRSRCKRGESTRVEFLLPTTYKGNQETTIDSTDSPKSNSKFALEKWRVGSDDIFLFLGMALFLGANCSGKGYDCCWHPAEVEKQRVCPWESWCGKTIWMGLVEDAYMNQHCIHLHIQHLSHIKINQYNLIKVDTTY